MNGKKVKNEKQKSENQKVISRKGSLKAKTKAKKWEIYQQKVENSK